LQLGANTTVEDDDPTSPQSLVNPVVSRGYGAGGRLHFTSFLDSNPLLNEEATGPAAA
jgi:hypothetical protein